MFAFFPQCFTRMSNNPQLQDPVYDIAETPCDCPCVDCDQEEGMCPADPRWTSHLANQPPLSSVRFGSFGKWSKWGHCSKTCGGGVRERTRSVRRSSPHLKSSDLPYTGSALLPMLMEMVGSPVDSVKGRARRLRLATM